MKGYFDKPYHVQVQGVKLSANNTLHSATATVTFPEAFVSPPVVLIVPPLPDAYDVWTTTAAPTTTGCTIKIASGKTSAMPYNATEGLAPLFYVVVISHERL